jgi:hypothetical protein
LYQNSELFYISFFTEDLIIFPYKITYWTTKECVQYSRHCQSWPFQRPSWFHIAYCEPKRLNQVPQTIGVIYRRFRKTVRFAYQIIKSAIKHSHQIFSHQVPVSSSSFNFNGRVYDWNVPIVITQFLSDNNRHEKRLKLVTYFSTFPAKFKKHLLCCKAYHTETYLRIERIHQKLYPQRNIVTSVLFINPKKWKGNNHHFENIQK